jgi:hypothetical protein
MLGSFISYALEILQHFWRSLIVVWDFLKGNLPFATLVGVFAALFKDEIVRLWRRPKLIARIKLEAPYCVKSPVHFTDGSQVIFTSSSYYYRIWVENAGNERAQRVQVYAAELLER